MTAKRRRSVVIFCMPGAGHFQRLRPLIAALSAAGIVAHVLTDCSAAADVERAGGKFFDLFSRYPIGEADAVSLPVSCRNVTFAATFAEPICRDVEELAPSLVIHDSFAVIGRVVANRLGIPRVNVCAGHNVAPAPFLSALSKDPRVNVSPACVSAAEVLRQSYGLADASPFSWVSALSRDLNIYCEPPEFLTAEERTVFEPVAFFGSLPCDSDHRAGAADRAWFGADASGLVKVYVSFGTVIWTIYPDAAIRALTTLAPVFAGMPRVEVLVSLGGAAVADDVVARIRQPNVSVEAYVDQWHVLQAADVFVTHHGLNSTHEAIFHRVPMLSYPFFWDQPALAKKCEALGLAIPLARELRGAIDPDGLRAALSRLVEERDAMQASLSRVREWELAVIAGRRDVLRRLIAFMR